MAQAYCELWRKPLKDVAEHEQESCWEIGDVCTDCDHLGECSGDEE